MNITLIGMPGSGKSSVGENLAKILHYKLVDPDKIMEKKFGRPLQEALEKIGEQAFLEEEGKTIVSSSKGKDELVIAPGGSVVYLDETMRFLKEISVIFYLEASLPVIKNRIGNELRGIVGIKGKTLKELYTERTPLYERWADRSVDGDRSVKKVAADIFEKLNAKNLS